MRTIFKALTAIQKDLSVLGIGKNSTNEFDKYKFRGIDDVLNALSPILAEHGVIIVPSVTSRETNVVATKSGGGQFHTILTVDYTLYDNEGDSITHTSQGEGMDRGDKSINKALTAAFKYFVFQAFCVPIQGHTESDTESAELQVSDPMMRHLEAVARNMASIQYIKEALSRDAYETAYEAFQEISEEDRQLLWMAPTKGGKAWTTKEIAQFKSNEWGQARKVYNGIATEGEAA